MKKLTPIIALIGLFACTSGPDSISVKVDTLPANPVVQQNDPEEGMDISSYAAVGFPVDVNVGNDFLSHMLYSIQKDGYMSDSPSVVSAKLLESEVFMQGVPQDYEPVYKQSKIGRYNAWIGMLHWYFLKTITKDNGSLSEAESYITLENISGVPTFQQREEKRPFNYLNPAFIDWCWQNFYRQPIAGQGIGEMSFASLYDVSFKKLFRTLVVAHEEAAAKGLANESKWYSEEIIRNNTSASTALPGRYTAPPARAGEIDTQYFPFASGFWLRRYIDGTEEKIWTYLRTAVMDYDYDWGCKHFKICDRG